MHLPNTVSELVIIHPVSLWFAYFPLSWSWSESHGLIVNQSWCNPSQQEQIGFQGTVGGREKSGSEGDGGGGMKAAVEVRCINAVYCKLHVGEPRLLSAEASCPMSAGGDKEGLKIVTVASKWRPLRRLLMSKQLPHMSCLGTLSGSRGFLFASPPCTQISLTSRQMLAADQSCCWLNTPWFQWKHMGDVRSWAAEAHWDC